MKEQPILFNAEIVRAILNGSKTQTRRLIKETNPKFFDPVLCTVQAGIPTYKLNKYGVLFKTNPKKWFSPKHPYHKFFVSPYGKIGDRLWVRETFMPLTVGYAYKADDLIIIQKLHSLKWKPSIHMPRLASRITLEVTNIRVERLHDITEKDAISEGICREIADGKDLGWINYLWHGRFGKYGLGNKQSDAWEYQYSTYQKAKDCFSSLWELINGMGSWKTNPWIWVVEFKIIKRYLEG